MKIKISKEFYAWLNSNECLSYEFCLWPERFQDEFNDIVNTYPNCIMFRGYSFWTATYYWNVMTGICGGYIGEESRYYRLAEDIEPDFE
jgi:hypothetical protein